MRGERKGEDSLVNDCYAAVTGQCGGKEAPICYERIY